MFGDYFAYLFNRVENQKYVDPIPLVTFDYYDYTKSMNERNSYTDIRVWLVNNNNHFDFQEEIAEYYIRDVEILIWLFLNSGSSYLNQRLFVA